MPMDEKQLVNGSLTLGCEEFASDASENLVIMKESRTYDSRTSLVLSSLGESSVLDESLSELVFDERVDDELWFIGVLRGRKGLFSESLLRRVKESLCPVRNKLFARVCTLDENACLFPLSECSWTELSFSFSFSFEVWHSPTFNYSINK